MEQVLERKVATGYEDIVLYDDYGNRVTNPGLLEAVAEGREILAEYLKRKEKHKIGR